MQIDIAGKLFPNFTTVIIQLCSTGVMLFFFKKYLWIPVQAYFEKRAQFIESTMTEAKEMNEKARQLMLESEEQSRESAKEYRDIVAKAKEDALKVHADIVDGAKQEAVYKIAQAEREIDVERQEAKQAMKEEMIEIAIDVAAKVLNKEMNTKENQQMVEDFVDKVVN